jgi:hypothetical protein
MHIKRLTCWGVHMPPLARHTAFPHKKFAQRGFGQPAIITSPHPPPKSSFYEISLSVKNNTVVPPVSRNEKSCNDINSYQSWKRKILDPKLPFDVKIRNTFQSIYLYIKRAMRWSTTLSVNGMLWSSCLRHRNTSLAQQCKHRIPQMLWTNTASCDLPIHTCHVQARLNVQRTTSYVRSEPIAIVIPSQPDRSTNVRPCLYALCSRKTDAYSTGPLFTA